MLRLKPSNTTQNKPQVQTLPLQCFCVRQPTLHVGALCTAYWTMFEWRKFLTLLEPHAMESLRTPNRINVECCRRTTSFDCYRVGFSESMKKSLIRFQNRPVLTFGKNLKMAKFIKCSVNEKTKLTLKCSLFYLIFFECVRHLKGFSFQKLFPYALRAFNKLIDPDKLTCTEFTTGNSHLTFNSLN